MGLFTPKNTKSIYEMSDSELIRFIASPNSISARASAIKEATSRGLKNPKTGKPYTY